MDKTDKAVGQILEAIQAITPEVAEQAVAYHRFTDAVWLGAWLAIALVATMLGVRFMAAVRSEGWYEFDGHGNVTGSGLGVILSACVSGVAMLACIGLACDLAATYIAPDYYAADCMLDLVRKVLH